MNKSLNTIVVLLLVCAAAIGVFGLHQKTEGNKQLPIVASDVAQNAVQQGKQAISAIEQAVSSIQPNNSAPNAGGQNVLLAVPFTIQAPFANWSDPIFQNACEEASLVMAMGWVNGTKSISPQEAKNQILDIVAFENKTFGYNADTDAADVVRIFKEYFNQPQATLRENITLEDIKSELQKGNLVLVPAFGQAFGNPNYTAPGPVAHMLAIIGYDSKAKQFITNDPGTKRGSGYRYNENVLFNAIWEYPSGDGPLDPPINSEMRKVMIIVSKN